MIPIVKFCTGLTLVIFVLFLYSRYLERSSLYYPSSAMEADPGSIGLDYKEIVFFAEDRTELHGWLIPAKEAEVTVIFAHGNGGNISHRLEKIAILHELTVNIFIFDYRGYGKSKGSPTEQGLYQDIKAAYDYIKDNYPKSKIVIYGESLGGAVAVDLAAKVNVNGLILEGTFTSVADMAKIVYPWLPEIFLHSKFDSLSKIGKINTPKLHLHGNLDQIVPIYLGQRLYEAAGEPKQLVLIDSGHNDSFFVSEHKIKAALKDFLSSLN